MLVRSMSGINTNNLSGTVVAKAPPAPPPGSAPTIAIGPRTSQIRSSTFVLAPAAASSGLKAGILTVAPAPASVSAGEVPTSVVLTAATGPGGVLETPPPPPASPPWDVLPAMQNAVAAAHTMLDGGGPSVYDTPPAAPPAEPSFVDKYGKVLAIGAVVFVGVAILRR